jgi:DNA-binding transcriptional MerR regulator
MNRLMSIGEFAKLTGVSLRTLRYYDQIDLLKPSHVSDSGRRYYTDRDLIPLQHIIALKYLDFSLDDIRGALPREPAGLKKSLKLQKEALLRKQERLAQMMKAIDYTLSVLEEAEPDTQVVSFLIHSVLKEQDYMRWMARHFPQPAVENMAEVMRTKELELTKRTAEIFQALKRDLPLYEPDHPQLQRYASQVMDLLKEMLGPEFKLEDLDLSPEAILEAPDTSIISPFTREEEQKLGEVFQYYTNGLKKEE